MEKKTKIEGTKTNKNGNVSEKERNGNKKEYLLRETKKVFRDLKKKADEGKVGKGKNRLHSTMSDNQLD